MQTAVTLWITWKTSSQSFRLASKIRRRMCKAQLCHPANYLASALAHSSDTVRTVPTPPPTHHPQGMRCACCRAQKLFPNFIAALKADGGDFKGKEADLVDVSPDHACQLRVWMPPSSSSLHDLTVLVMCASALGVFQ